MKNENMKQPEREEIPKYVKILGVICGVGFMIYYEQSGNDLPTSFLSGIIAGFLSYLGLCFLYGILSGAIELALGKTPAEESTKEPEQQAKDGKKAIREEKFEVLGAFYHKESIARVAIPNPEWKKTCKALIDDGKDCQKIYRFKRTTKKAALKEEPQNKYDKDAVAIYVEGQKIGYIPAEDAGHVKRLIKKKAIQSVTATITGGSYKIVYSEDEMTTDETGPYVDVTIRRS